jgi:diaminohydroxyphosphoribosylaminopyrimidine deaminase/5-amino-6-(5-phosphoribosylamino)uracil reductase
MLIAGPEHDGDNLGELESRGVVVIPTDSDDPIEMVSAALSEMGTRAMTNVMLEGGGELLASFFTAGQIDECRVYIGAKAFGGMHAKGPIAGSGVQRVADAWSLQLVSVDQFDHDLRVVYRKS